MHSLSGNRTQFSPVEQIALSQCYVTDGLIKGLVDIVISQVWNVESVEQL